MARPVDPGKDVLREALTAVRSKEAREARWDEIDSRTRVWTLPAARTKTGFEHRKPLSDAALAVLFQSQRLCGDSPFVFPAPRSREKPFHHPLLREVLERCGVLGRTTVHGFRATFRTWTDECAEACGFQSKVITHSTAK